MTLESCRATWDQAVKEIGIVLAYDVVFANPGGVFSHDGIEIYSEKK